MARSFIWATSAISELTVIPESPINTFPLPEATTPPCAVPSPILAAGKPLMKTLDEPADMESGGPMHTAMSPCLAAGRELINTLDEPAATGQPTWGILPVLSGQE
ncbi:conserved hypothetical protein [Vibrio nigripulchritudo SFn135]|nr:conserved hypothetical protein [Vibrio nigripulchritudo SFn135]